MKTEIERIKDILNDHTLNLLASEISLRESGKNGITKNKRIQTIEKVVELRHGWTNGSKEDEDIYGTNYAFANVLLFANNLENRKSKGITIVVTQELWRELEDADTPIKNEKIMIELVDPLPFTFKIKILLS